MALLTFMPDPSAPRKQQLIKHSSNSKLKKKHGHKGKVKQSSSWDQIKHFLTCKQIEDSKIHDPSVPRNNNNTSSSTYTSCSSICTFRDVVHGNTRVVHRADYNSPAGSSLGRGRLGAGGAAYSGKGMQLKKLSGCYECHAFVDPTRYPLPRTTLCACPVCGEVFSKIESLENHQAVRHAVSELGPEDSSRNIVEIIFKSSWLKKDSPICKIERILKVHNTQRTIQRFEDCRDAVKLRVNSSNVRKNARCAADGNELLRFHCAALTCSLGARGSSSLCGSVPSCGVCTIIRHGFQGNKVSGVRTTASSGRAHDCLGGSDTRRAMLVCRVIAGRVKRVVEDASADEDGAAAAALGGGSYDSVAGCPGIYSNMEELCVFNPRAILPCFVVIYKALEH